LGKHLLELACFTSMRHWRTYQPRRPLNVHSGSAQLIGVVWVCAFNAVLGGHWHDAGGDVET
jgi:hypothetical protein